MYALIDWQTQGLVREPGSARILAFNTYRDADLYGAQNLQIDLYTVVRVPQTALTFIAYI